MAKIIHRAIPIGAIDEFITPPPRQNQSEIKKNESADSFYLLLVEYRSFKKKKKFNLSFHFQSQYFSCYSVKNNIDGMSFATFFEICCHVQYMFI